MIPILIKLEKLIEVELDEALQTGNQDRVSLCVQILFEITDAKLRGGK